MFLGSCIVALVGCALAALFGVPFPATPPEPPAEHRDEIVPSEFAAALPPREIYRYSVINGGAYTGDELAAAIQRDRVVADHYRAIDVARVRAETVPEDRLAYMSYRRGDQVYWTKHKVRLRQGETILTDGTTQVRARCGNCIALEPMEPTAEDEPPAVEFEALTAAPILIPSQPFSLHTGIVPPGLLLPPPFGTVPFVSIGPIPIGPLTENFGGFDPNIPVDFGLPGPNPVLPLPPSDFPIPDGLPPSGLPPVIVNIPPPFDPPLDVPEDFPPENPPADPVPVPEPGTLLLVGGGGIGMVLRRLRSKAKPA